MQGICKVLMFGEFCFDGGLKWRVVKRLETLSQRTNRMVATDECRSPLSQYAGRPGRGQG
jgi:hypothetical protein